MNLLIVLLNISFLALIPQQCANAQASCYHQMYKNDGDPDEWRPLMCHHGVSIDDDFDNADKFYCFKAYNCKIPNLEQPNDMRGCTDKDEADFCSTFIHSVVNKTLKEACEGRCHVCKGFDCNHGHIPDKNIISLMFFPMTIVMYFILH